MIRDAHLVYKKEIKMKQFFVLCLVVVLFFAYTNQANAQCENGKCFGPMVKVVTKMKQGKFFELKLERQKTWKRPNVKNWFKRSKRWGCK